MDFRSLVSPPGYSANLNDLISIKLQPIRTWLVRPQQFLVVGRVRRLHVLGVAALVVGMTFQAVRDRLPAARAVLLLACTFEVQDDTRPVCGDRHVRP